MVSGEKVRGQVVEALPNATFSVKVGDELVFAYLAGKMRINHIKTIPGDNVDVILSPNGSKGRIVKRL